MANSANESLPFHYEACLCWLVDDSIKGGNYFRRITVAESGQSRAQIFSNHRRKRAQELVRRPETRTHERAGLSIGLFIAITALLVSALTAGALVYQTTVIAKQYASAIWPYLSVDSTYDPTGETIAVVNDGLGPAVIGSAQLSVDGKKVSAWNDYLATLAKEPVIRTLFLRARSAVLSGRATQIVISMSSIGPSTTIRGGDSRIIFKISFGSTTPVQVAQALSKHVVAIDLCYCSLNGSCWKSRATPGQNSNINQQSVSECTNSAAINSTSVPPPRSYRMSH